MSHFSNVYPAWNQPQAQYAAPHWYATPEALDEQDNRFPGFLALFASSYFLAVSLFSKGAEGISIIPQLVAVCMGILWLIIGVFVRPTPLNWSRPVAYYVAWCIWAASGVIVADSPSIFFSRYLVVLKVVATTFVIAQCVRTRTDFLTCMLFVGLANFILFYQGIEEIMRAAAVTERGAGQRAGGTEDVKGNANSLANIALISITGGIACFFVFRKWLLKMIALAAIPPALYIVAATGSRKGMLCLLIIGIGMYFIHFRKAGGSQTGKRVAMTLIGFAVAIGSVYLFLKMPFLWRLTETFSDSSRVQEEARLQYFFMAVSAVMESPILGYGIDGFRVSITGAAYSHSTISESLACTGFPGFFIYFSGYAAMLLLLRRLRKAGLPERDLAVVNTILIIFLVFMLYSSLSVIYYNRTSWPVIGAACGYLNTLRKQYLVTAQPLRAI